MLAKTIISDIPPKISDVIKRLSLIITISMAIVGTMLASEIMISKEEISKTNVEESIETAKIDTNLQEKIKKFNLYVSILLLKTNMFCLLI